MTSRFRAACCKAFSVKWGYEVVSADDGDAAWENLKSPDAPRMALLDWMMPGQNGVDVCRELRKLRPEPYTYILLLTAKDAKESVVEGLESGADDYLTKPFNPQELQGEDSRRIASARIWKTTSFRPARPCASRPRTIPSPESGTAARSWKHLERETTRVPPRGRFSRRPDRRPGPLQVRQ